MKTFEGVVVSAKMLKTAVVEVTRKTSHPLYKKLLKRSKKYKVDTSGFEVAVGDWVSLRKTRPISKEKHFKIHEILARAQEGESSKEKPATTEDTEKISVKTVVARKTSRKRGRIKHDSA